MRSIRASDRPPASARAGDDGLRAVGLGPIEDRLPHRTIGADGFPARLQPERPRVLGAGGRVVRGLALNRLVEGCVVDGHRADHGRRGRGVGELRRAPRPQDDDRPLGEGLAVASTSRRVASVPALQRMTGAWASDGVMACARAIALPPLAYGVDDRANAGHSSPARRSGSELTGAPQPEDTGVRCSRSAVVSMKKARARATISRASSSCSSGRQSRSRSARRCSPVAVRCDSAWSPADVSSTPAEAVSVISAWSTSSPRAASSAATSPSTWWASPSRSVCGSAR